MTEGVTQDAFMRAQEDVHQTFLLQFFFSFDWFQFSRAHYSCNTRAYSGASSVAQW